MYCSDRFISPILMNTLGQPVLLSRNSQGQIAAKLEARPGESGWVFTAEEQDAELLERLDRGEEVRGIIRLEENRYKIRFRDDHFLAEEMKRRRLAHLDQEVKRHLQFAARRMEARLRGKAVTELCERAGFRHSLAHKIVLSGILARGNQTGDNARTVAHIITVDGLQRGRLRRPEGSPLCGPSDGSFGLSSTRTETGQQICKGCAGQLEKLAGATLAETITLLRNQEQEQAKQRLNGRSLYAIARQNGLGSAPTIHTFMAESEQEANEARQRLEDGSLSWIGALIPLDSNLVNVLGAEILEIDAIHHDRQLSAEVSSPPL